MKTIQRPSAWRRGLRRAWRNGILRNLAWNSVSALALMVLAWSGKVAAEHDRPLVAGILFVLAVIGWLWLFSSSDSDSTRTLSVRLGELSSPKTDTRPDRGGYVSGEYIMLCRSCGDYYAGSKSSASCSDCAREALRN